MWSRLVPSQGSNLSRLLPIYRLYNQPSLYLTFNPKNRPETCMYVMSRLQIGILPEWFKH